MYVVYCIKCTVPAKQNVALGKEFIVCPQCKEELDTFGQPIKVTNTVATTNPIYYNSMPPVKASGTSGVQFYTCACATSSTLPCIVCFANVLIP